MAFTGHSHLLSAVILLRKRQLVTLFELCYCCLCSLSLALDALSWSVVVAFTGHTHLLFCRHLSGEMGAGYFTLFYSSCRLAVCVLRLVSWSVVCDSGIYRSYSLAFCSRLSEEIRAGYFTLKCVLVVVRLSVFCVSSSGSSKLVCGLKLWHLQVIFTCFLKSSC